MPGSLAGLLFVASLALALVVVHRPLGDLPHWIATSPRDLRAERWAYRLVGADPKAEQSLERVRAQRLAFSAVSVLFLYRTPSAAATPVAQSRRSRGRTGSGLEHCGELCDEYELAVLLG